ncbi:MAG: glycoside hydrolase family 13 protein [Prolixibacteraceae bacterium]|nr:glycoside hydrolase family 13 protein [Prolixibacteraceae bacterium]
MRRITITVIILTLGIFLLRAEITRIDPPNWWAGFNNNELQLMVYGEGISGLKPVVEYEGVVIHSVTRPQSNNYLFVNLVIADDVEPGTFSIYFKDGEKTIDVHQYELKQRTENSAYRESFDNSDVLYLLFPDRFANGDPSNDSVEGLTDKDDRDDPFGRHGGDIQGILDNLDYLQELGITAIWTTPLLEDNQPSASYHHYATTDYYRVDPRFGTNQEYKQMVNECHRRGMKVIMDMIPNHCGSAHPWMADLPFDDWINGGTTYIQTNYRIATTNDPYVSAVDANLNFNGWFVREMPDLNQNNPFMLTYLKQFAIWWLEYTGLDGIRVDTYPYNDPWKAAEWTFAIRNEFPGLNIVGECWQHSPAEVAYWQSGTLNYNGYDSGLPALMDFAMHDAVSVAFNENVQGWDRGVGQLWNTLAQDYFYADPYNLVTLLENHDTQRFSTQVGNDVEKYKLAYTFLLTTRGIPQIYYGGEIMMGGDKAKGDGDIRREMPGGWADHQRSVFDPVQRTATENEIFNHIALLIRFRKENPVMQTGSLLHFIPENNVYTYFRIDNEKRVMVILNNSPEEQNLGLSRFSEAINGHVSGKDVFTNNIYNLTGNLTVKGKTALVLELQ